MKLSSYLKFSLGFLLLIIFTSASLDDQKKNKIPFENGMLNGLVEIKLPYLNGSNQSDGLLTGEYVQNQKVGSWKLYDKAHNLLMERNYDNNFEYSIKGVTADQLKLKKNKKDFYIYNDIKEENVGASLRVWKVISNRLLEANPETKMALMNMDLNGIKSYLTDNLRKETKETNFDIRVDKILIMGDWFYNTKLQLSEYRVLAISLVAKNSKGEAPWYYYPDIRERLHEFGVHGNNPMIMNLDDLFFFGEYPSEIYKVESVEGKAFDEKKLRQETIKTIEKLLVSEVALW